ncbi:alpha/beta fold hydrolase [Nocardioides bruguierae]|uniref:alpha/beta fold hydrolase n=1 Tax=Nocardioides bruguierae TaxID=2945102 RepID=UPI0020206BD2|nr:alpha/beta fold hydrolase [Nocardioides bruguierae]MCL8025788.1 alpha/beta fold hydrolase [Nocardioides bruguierae]
MAHPGTDTVDTPVDSPVHPSTTALRDPDGHDPSDVATSGLLRAPVSGDLELCYQTFGDPADEPLLLVMGLGGPLTWWDERLCRMLARRGFHVVRYDNRDAGRSTSVASPARRTAVVRTFLGLPTPVPYGMAELADDAVALLDHLDLPAAHVAGISMGGMIAQTLAINAPERVWSLSSLMSTTGRRAVGWQHPSLLAPLLSDTHVGRERTEEEDRDAYVRQSVRTWRLTGSPGWPLDDEALAQRARDTWDHGVNRAGTVRQMLAVLTAPDREPALREVGVPTLVLHGLADRMVHVSGGRATAAAVPDAELVLVEGLGHDVPLPLFGLVADALRRTADRAERPTR